MAYTDFDDKVIHEAWGLLRITVGAACRVGDLLNRDGTLAISTSKPAHYVATQSGASGDTIWAARFALCGRKSTIAAGGVVTVGDHSGSADDVIWLSATAGRPSATPVANIGQMVGVCVDSEKFTLEPKEAYDPHIELISSNDAMVVADAGKQFYVVADAITITLPTGAALDGLGLVIVNGMNDGECLVTVSPVSADKITGNGRAGVNNKDALNTKATARAGDRIELVTDGAATNSVWYVRKEVGTWAAEA